ncbi:hypothetical protein Gotri_023028, partial [Gossypium trilobum]|nr:hypothetical protein [Gossypium trilobum]
MVTFLDEWNVDVEDIRTKYLLGCFSDTESEKLVEEQRKFDAVIALE